MTKLLIFLTVLAPLLGCTTCSVNDNNSIGALPGIPLTLDPSLQISTPDGGIGHACPVNGVVITANHVVYNSELMRYFQYFAWSDGRNKEGLGTVLFPANGLDLVIVAVNAELVYLPVGVVNVGDRVFWFEYDFRTRQNALRARRRFADVMRIVAQQIILDDTPMKGASGSCLINTKGEVVGIVNASWSTEDKRGAGNAVKLPALPE